MDFETLKDFIQRRMRMLHVYQPAMIKPLLNEGGHGSLEQVAQALLSHDQSQVEYYEKITKEMPCRVLQNHGIVEPIKEGRRTQGYKLHGAEELTSAQTNELIALCESRISEYIERRGSAIWAHRRQASGYISGTAKYDVLNRAGFHCDLCGVSADEKALEVDHIIPRAKGGTDDPSNLQALCYMCNAMKRDRDDTDLHAVRESFKHRADDCLFCEMPDDRVVDENEMAYLVRDGVPVTPRHSLGYPKTPR